MPLLAVIMKIKWSKSQIRSEDANAHPHLVVLPILLALFTTLLDRPSSETITANKKKQSYKKYYCPTVDFRKDRRTMDVHYRY